MSKMSIRTILLTVLLAFPAWLLPAQNVKTIAVGQDASYTDHISLAEDSRDKDIMVKFVYDQQNNSLTVSVLSYRNLFVFREATRYKGTVSGRRLNPEHLPYVAESEKVTRFYLSKALKKSLPRPRRKYVFQRWIEYDGLQPAQQDYKMVNDYIEQAFEILPKRTSVVVTLRDLYLLEPEGNKYELLCGRDLNTSYVVRILQDPCFGKEDERAAAQKLTEDIKAAYAAFKKNYGSGKVATPDALKTFQDTQTALLTQFPPRQNVSDCPDIKDAVEQYNSYVDSIGAITCQVKLDVDMMDSTRELDSKMVYSQARQLDKYVARWLVSKDELEKEDLVKQCKEIITDMNTLLQRALVVTPDQKQAVTVYREAEKYFRKTCKQ